MGKKKKKSIKMLIRLNATDHALLRKKAEDIGLSMNDYLRLLIRNGGTNISIGSNEAA